MERKGTVASLPIRNWNGGSEGAVKCGDLGCEPTYKELKPKLSGLERMWQKGCEPTYKELKLKPHSPQTFLYTVASLPIRNWNFTPLNPSPDTWSSVASLPIRNWNPTPISTLTFCFTVASLPIRNWNSVLPVILSAEISVASLPIRNWNSEFWYMVSEENYRCEPTYKELKLIR